MQKAATRSSVRQLLTNAAKSSSRFCQQRHYSEAAEHSVGPLCKLTETETMTKNMVAKFAREVVAPKVKQMDEAAEMDKDIIKACFDQGLMGIEIEEKYGGGGMSFMVRYKIFKMCTIFLHSSRCSSCYCHNIVNIFFYNIDLF